MKSSRKILLITGCVVLIGLIVSLGVMRNVALRFLHKTATESNYRSVSVADFQRLDFSANWDVRIWQGSEFKVEIAIDKNSAQNPQLENRDGTLYFKTQVIDSTKNAQPFFAKIIAPSLKGIKAMRGSKISLERFQSDSIELILEDGNAFKSYNARFNYILFRTSGDVSVQLTDDDSIIQ